MAPSRRNAAMLPSNGLRTDPFPIDAPSPLYPVSSVRTCGLRRTVIFSLASFNDPGRISVGGRTRRTLRAGMRGAIQQAHIRRGRTRRTLRAGMRGAIQQAHIRRGPDAPHAPGRWMRGAIQQAHTRREPDGIALRE